MRAIIDRLEEDKAVIELDGAMFTVPRALFDGAQEGDHIEITVLGKPQDESGITAPKDTDESAPAEAVEAESVIADDAESGDDPRRIFERLRAKRQRRSRSPDGDPDPEKHVDKC
jgi:hypothetical protein